MKPTSLLFAVGLSLGLSFGLTLAPTLATAAPVAVPDQLVTGPERGTYVQIGRDLSRLVAEPAGLSLTVVPTRGSAENVKRLRTDAGVRLALVQSDVYQAFKDEAAAGNQEASRLIKPLRVVLPLFDEEIYFVARADSPLKYIHEIRDKRINIGPVGSGTALTATTVYRQMFGTSIGEKNASFLTNEEALMKLATDQTLDVAVIVAGQPAKLFADMKQDARGYIKLLKLDPRAEESRAAMTTYTPSLVRMSSYPNWLTEDVPALTIRSLLVTYNFQTPAARQMLTSFATSLCSRFGQLKANGHPKWRDVQITLPPLTKGWGYYPPTQRALSRCENTPEKESLAVPVVASANCPQNKAILGLCRP